MPNPKSILLIEGDRFERLLIGEYLRSSGEFRILESEDIGGALSIKDGKRPRPAAAIIGMGALLASAPALRSRLRAWLRSAPVLALHDLPLGQYRTRRKSDLWDANLEKPFSLRGLESALRRALEPGAGR